MVFTDGPISGFISRGHNLIATGAFNQPGDLVTTADPRLMPLDNYGGPGPPCERSMPVVLFSIVQFFSVRFPALKMPAPLLCTPFAIVRPERVAVAVVTLKIWKLDPPMRWTRIFCPPPSIARSLSMTSSALGRPMV